MTHKLGRTKGSGSPMMAVDHSTAANTAHRARDRRRTRPDREGLGARTLIERVWTLHCKAMRYRFRWMLVRVKAKREVLTAESTTTGKNWAPFVFFKSPTCAIPVVGKVGSPVARDTGST